MSATEKIMDEVRALVVLDVTPESPGQLAALRHTIARTIGGLERARDAALEERNRLGVELTGARTRIADLETRAAAAAAEMMAWADRDAERDQRERAHREMALRAMAEAYALRAEAERLRAELAQARRDRDMLRLCMNDAACRALIAERNALAARLAEIERAMTAPVQAEPVGGCADRVSCPRGER